MPGSAAVVNHCEAIAWRTDKEDLSKSKNVELQKKTSFAGGGKTKTTTHKAKVFQELGSPVGK